MRLYDVAELSPGQQVTLCDALDTGAPTVTVRDKAGSDAALAGSAVQFASRELADPKGVPSNRATGHQPKTRTAGPDLQAEATAEVIEQFYSPAPATI